MSKQKEETFDPEVPFSRIGVMFTAALNERGMNVREFSDSLNMVSYEHFRKIGKGEEPPSKSLLGNMCAIFDWDYDEMLLVLTGDLIRRDYGEIGLEAMGIAAESDAFNRAWSTLTQEERNDLLVTLHQYVSRHFPTKRNKKPATVEMISKKPYTKPALSVVKKSKKG